jgi:hypothetical protein
MSPEGGAARVPAACIQPVTCGQIVVTALDLIEERGAGGEVLPTPFIGRHQTIFSSSRKT